MDKADEYHIRLGFLNATLNLAILTSEEKEKYEGMRIETKKEFEEFLEERKKLALTARGIDKKVMRKNLVGD